MRSILFALIGFTVVTVATQTAHAADQTILGSSIQAKNPDTPDKRKVTVKAKEAASPNTIVGDPVASGATLTVTIDGTTPSSQSFPLPQGTSLSGKPFWSGDAIKGYKYKDAKGEQGPVTKVQIKKSGSGTFALSAGLSGKVMPLSIVPPNPGTDACALLAIGGGGDSYSVQFSGGEITNKSAELYSHKSVTTEGSCVGDPVCGNGVEEGTEACDDGNTTPCDGCTPDCQLDSSVTYAVGPALAEPIPDDMYDGSIESMVCAGILIPDEGDGIVDYVCPVIGVQHSSVGDLVVRVRSIQLWDVNVLSRPGFAEPADNGSNGEGDSSNLSALSPIMWRPDGTNSPELMGSTIDDNQSVCADDSICDYASAGDLSIYVGQSGFGFWRVCVADANPSDTGTLEYAALVIGQ